MAKNIWLLLLGTCMLSQLAAQTVTMDNVGAYPFVTELNAAATGQKIAFTVNEKGHRNIYVAEGPAFSYRKLTAYAQDDGQEITSVSISDNGRWVVYVRGGDHGAYDERTPRNPASMPQPPKVQVYAVPFEGGTPVLLSEGDYPVISPQSNQVAYIHKDEVWISPLNGKTAARKMFYVRGKVSGIKWSPDGNRLLFVAAREDHALVGVFKDSLNAITWMAPAFSRDRSPQWSPDGQKIAFIRTAASGGFPDSLTAFVRQPWSVWTADARTGKGAEIWKAPETRRGSLPATNGGTNLHWTAHNRITYVSYEDGWPHLYSLPETGGTPVCLTPGNFVVEHVKLSPDKQWLLFSTNAGKDSSDYDRRHLARVPVNRAEPEWLTHGSGLESNPVMLGNGEELAALFATAHQPNLPGILSLKTRKVTWMASGLLPKDFPASALVVPRSVRFKAEDGGMVYGQLFEPATTSAKKPAVLFVHGGPQRQMLLGWHYGDYYSNTYALNQYLASQGFVVLAVNYRLGIGYGFDFQHPEASWSSGASEYLDIRAAGKWLAALPGVDPARIGIYGGSYGGFLTAMALAKDSEIFAAGVDIHGEHNLNVFLPKEQAEPAPDLELSKKLTWKSSPVAWLDTWTSPVLIIHGDDDGNVPFQQSIDLINRLKKKNIPFESLFIPDDTHHWMKYENMIRVDKATAEFLNRKLNAK